LNAALIDGIAIDSVRRYADSLTFEPSRGQVALVTFVPYSFGTGDTARIEPEQGSHRVSRSELEQGRIIARIMSHTVYPARAFGPTWWTYWWVDKRGPHGQWRSLFIPSTRSADSTYHRPAALLTPKHYAWWKYFRLHAKAYFVPDTDGVWGSCDNMCCSSPTS